MNQIHETHQNSQKVMDLKATKLLRLLTASIALGVLFSWTDASLAHSFPQISPIGADSASGSCQSTLDSSDSESWGGLSRDQQMIILELQEKVFERQVLKRRIYDRRLLSNLKPILSYEDLAQEAFFRMVRALKRGQFDPAQSQPLTYFSTIMSNLIKTYNQRAYRGTAREIGSGAFTDSLDSDRDFFSEIPDPRGSSHPEIELQRAEIRQLVKDILITPQPDVLIEVGSMWIVPLRLREIDKLSYQEIAARLDINLETVKSRIYRAKDKLRRYLRRHYPNLVINFLAN